MHLRKWAHIQEYILYPYDCCFPSFGNIPEGECTSALTGTRSSRWTGAGYKQHATTWPAASVSGGALPSPPCFRCFAWSKASPRSRRGSPALLPLPWGGLPPFALPVPPPTCKGVPPTLSTYCRWTRGQESRNAPSPSSGQLIQVVPQTPRAGGKGRFSSRSPFLLTRPPPRNLSRSCCCWAVHLLG